MIKIGEDVTEELWYQKPRLRVKQIVRSKWACREDAQGVVTAPLPPRLIDRGRPGVSLLVFLIVAKYIDHSVPREAMCEMRVGPSQPGCRTWPQTALSCAGKEPGW